MSHHVNILETTPSQKIFFSGPFSEISKTTLTLKNPTFKNLIFKVRTTEPKRYCVRPNLGIMKPQETVTVAVILQPSDDSIFSLQGQHKFQILHFLLEEYDEGKTALDLWSEANPALVFHNKLQCFFETPFQAEQRRNEEEQEENVSNLKDASKLVCELRSRVDDLKRDNSRLLHKVSETQKRLELALKPSQFPDLLIYIVIAIFGWLFAKFVI